MKRTMLFAALLVVSLVSFGTSLLVGNNLPVNLAQLSAIGSMLGIIAASVLIALESRRGVVEPVNPFKR